MKSGILVIYSSPNGRGNWVPVPPESVPDWLKAHDTLGELVAGQMCCKADEADPVWYRAEQVETPTADTEIKDIY